MIRIHGSALFIWGLYIILSPVYILPQPGPQPADFIMVSGIAIVLPVLFLKRHLPLSPPVIWGGLFVMLAICINITNGLLSDFDKRFFLTSLMMPYNLCVFILTAYIFKHCTPKTSNCAYLIILLVIASQCAWIILTGSTTDRITGTFSNPNQLAYWSLLSAMMILCLKNDKPIDFKDTCILLILLFLQTTALSKAGIITYVLLLGIVFILFPIKPVIRILSVIAVFSTVLLTIALLITPIDIAFDVPVVDRVADRLGTIGQEYDDSITGRHYDRIWKHPEYLLFGAGEGGFNRFNQEAPIEMHSGLGTVLFSYGIVGFGLFLAFIYCIVRGIPLRYQLFLIPLFLYGLTHQNIRFTHFWVVLGMLYSIPNMLMVNDNGKN